MNSPSSLPLLVLSLVSIVAHGHIMFHVVPCGCALLLRFMAELELISFPYVVCKFVAMAMGGLAVAMVMVGFTTTQQRSSFLTVLSSCSCSVLLLCYSLWSRFLLLLLLVVPLCYSLWSSSIAPCGGPLLLFLVAYYCSLWSYSLWPNSIAPCAHILLLLVVTLCYLWSCSITTCDRVLLLILVIFCSSMFVSPPCGCISRVVFVTRS